MRIYNEKGRTQWRWTCVLLVTWFIRDGCCLPFIWYNSHLGAVSWVLAKAQQVSQRMKQQWCILYMSNLFAISPCMTHLSTRLRRPFGRTSFDERIWCWLASVHTKTHARYCIEVECVRNFFEDKSWRFYVSHIFRMAAEGDGCLSTAHS